jgi:hypothetical protein
MPFILSSFPLNNKLTGGSVNMWLDMTHTWFPMMGAKCYYSNMEVMGLPNTVCTNSSWSFNSKNKVLSLDASNAPSALELYDLQGRKVASHRNLNTTNITLNHLRRGMYLIELNSKKGMERGKLLVE